jgi:hypothetical protein
MLDRYMANQQQIDPTTGLPIYENFSSQHQANTPNYVPASVYRQRGSTTPTPIGTNMGYETVTVNLIRQPAGFGFRLVGGTEVRLGRFPSNHSGRTGIDPNQSRSHHAWRCGGNGSSTTV